MANETELERLVVRLVGDSTSYQKMLAESGAALKKQEVELARASSAVERHGRKMKAAGAIVESVRTPTELYRRELAVLRGHLRAGRIGQETFNRALAKLQLTAPKTAAELAKVAAAEKLLATQTELATQAVARQDRRLKSASLITASVRTKTELYRRQVALLTGHLRAGRISQETFNRAMLQANAILPPTIALTARLSTSLKGVATAATAAGIGLLKITAPLGIIGFLSVRAFAKFDQAMVESTSIMDVTIGQTERMRNVALDLSKVSAQGPAELARSYFFLASAGLDAEQSMAALPVVTKFATAGAFDMARATDLLTDAQSALGLTVKDTEKNMLNMTRISDVLVKANTLANASVEQFATALTSKAGASLKVFNKDAEEGVAVLAAFADQGVKSELAGNALDRIIRLLSKSALSNADAHERLGFKVFDVSGKMRNMGSIVANLENVVEGLGDKQRSATLKMLGFEARVQQVILPLLGTSKAIMKYEEELRKAGGTTADVADKQMKSFSNQMKIAKNQLTVTAIAIGEQLVPSVISLVNSVKPMLVGIAKWIKAHKSLVPALAATTAALVVLGTGLIAFGAITTALGGPIGVIALAVGALTFAYQKLNEVQGEIVREMEGVRQKGDMLRESHLRQFAELKRLAEETSLTKDEQVRAQEIVDTLTKAYGRIGIEIDKYTGAVNVARGATDRLNESMAKRTVKQIESELEEATKNFVVERNKLRAVLNLPGFDAEGKVIKETIKQKTLRNLGDVFGGTTAERRASAEGVQAQKNVDDANLRIVGLQIRLDKINRDIKKGRITARDLVGKEGAGRLEDEAEKAGRDAAAAAMEAKALAAATKAGAGLKNLEDQLNRGARIIEQFATPEEIFEKTLDDLIRLLDVGALGEGAKGERVFAKAVAEANKKLAESNDLLQEGIRLTKEMRTPQEVFNKRLERLNTLLEEDAIGLGVYAKAVERAKEELNSAKKAADALKSSLGITAAEIGSRELLAQGLAFAQLDRGQIQGPQLENPEDLAKREAAELFKAGPGRIEATAEQVLENAKLFARMVAAQERLVEIEEGKEDINLEVADF